MKTRIYATPAVKGLNPRSQLNNHLIAKLVHSNFHSLEVVSRSRDPQLQVSENYSALSNLRPRFFFLEVNGYEM